MSATIFQQMASFFNGRSQAGERVIAPLTWGAVYFTVDIDLDIEL
jgi:hypothetical protein